MYANKYTITFYACLEGKYWNKRFQFKVIGLQQYANLINKFLKAGNYIKSLWITDNDTGNEVQEDNISRVGHVHYDVNTRKIIFYPKKGKK